MESNPIIDSPELILEEVQNPPNNKSRFIALAILLLVLISATLMLIIDSYQYKDGYYLPTWSYYPLLGVVSTSIVLASRGNKNWNRLVFIYLILISLFPIPVAGYSAGLEMFGFLLINPIGLLLVLIHLATNKDLKQKVIGRIKREPKQVSPNQINFFRKRLENKSSDLLERMIAENQLSVEANAAAQEILKERRILQKENTEVSK